MCHCWFKEDVFNWQRKYSVPGNMSNINKTRLMLLFENCKPHLVWITKAVIFNMITISATNHWSQSWEAGSANQPIMMRKFYWYQPVDYLLHVSISNIDFNSHLYLLLTCFQFYLSYFGVAATSSNDRLVTDLSKSGSLQSVSRCGC